jgi:hypothetical protein
LQGQGQESSGHPCLSSYLLRSLSRNLFTPVF